MFAGPVGGTPRLFQTLIDCRCVNKAAYHVWSEGFTTRESWAHLCSDLKRGEVWYQGMSML